MAQIRISPEQLRACSNTCKGYGNDCEDLIRKTQTLIDSLRDQWEGQASEKYAQQFAELRPAFDRMRNLYEELSGQLDGTAQAMENLDQEIASKFGVQ
jgi:WXG100 family type VII secretion target